jgi:hypothetical protein
MSVETLSPPKTAEHAKPALPTSIRPFLRRRAAAKYLTDRGLPTAFNTLQKLATTGGGPVFRKFGRWPLYREEDLDDWARTRLSEPMTSTPPAKKRPAPSRRQRSAAATPAEASP